MNNSTVAVITTTLSISLLVCGRKFHDLFSVPSSTADGSTADAVSIHSELFG